MISIDIPPRHSPTSYLVEIRPESAGRFTAQLLCAVDLRATAATRDEAVEQLRTLIRERLDSGSLVWVEVPQENPLMRWFGHAKDDPTFPEYLEEIRRFREEMDHRDDAGSGPSECSDTSLTPTT
jgi:hypothetical protein